MSCRAVQLRESDEQKLLDFFLFWFLRDETGFAYCLFWMVRACHLHGSIAFLLVSSDAHRRALLQLPLSASQPKLEAILAFCEELGMRSACFHGHEERATCFSGSVGFAY